MSDATNRRRLTPAVWLATGLGVGLVAPAPGTVGAVWGLPWAWWIVSGAAPTWAGWATVAAGVALGVPLCTRAARDLGGQKDPGAIVWDEIATVPLVFLIFECGMYAGWGNSFATLNLSQKPAFCITLLVLGFALHRFFDILKFPPCRRLERLPDGLGVMLDDVVAAVYAGIACTLLIKPVSFVLWMFVSAESVG